MILHINIPRIFPRVPLPMLGINLMLLGVLLLSSPVTYAQPEPTNATASAKARQEAERQRLGEPEKARQEAERQRLDKLGKGKPDQPIISWTPPSISETVSQGETKTFSVSFISRKDKHKNIFVKVSPEIKSFVQIDPQTLGDIEKGEARSLNMTIAVSGTAQIGTYNGTIQLGKYEKNRKIVKKVFLNPLPVTLIIASAGPQLPPDPGDAGKTTLEGIDSDNDGIRDDLQRYIALTYPNSAKTRAALTQVTKVLQSALIDSNDKAASLNHASELDRSMECLLFIHPGDDGANILNALRAETLNTNERSVAFLKHDSQLGGEVFASKRISEYSSSCIFDPNALEN